jgi:hypothetical protein
MITIIHWKKNILYKITNIKRFADVINRKKTCITSKVGCSSGVMANLELLALFAPQDSTPNNKLYLTNITKGELQRTRKKQQESLRALKSGIEKGRTHFVSTIPLPTTGITTSSKFNLEISPESIC